MWRVLSRIGGSALRTRTPGLWAALLLAPALALAATPAAAPAPAPKGATTGQAPAPTVAPATPGAPAADTPVHVETTLEGDSVKLGERVTLVVTLTYPADAQVHFPGRPFVGKRVRLAGNIQAREQKDTTVVERNTLTLVPVRTGKAKIPAIEVPYVLKDGTAGTATSEAQRVVVGSLLASQNDPSLKPARPPVPYEQWNWWLIWGSAALGVALLAAVVTLVAVRLYAKHLRGLAPPPPPRPAHEVAYERLATLKEKGLPNLGMAKEFYLELTEIAREYFGNRYAIGALGETSTELVDALERIEPQGLGMEELRVFLGDADLVKFAKRTPDKVEMDSALVQAQLFVDRTREEARERQAAKEPAKPVVVEAPITKRAFGFLIDLVLYSLVSLILLVAMRSTGKGWLVWLDLGLLLVFLLLRDMPAVGSPGKALAGLRVLASEGDGFAPLGARILRNVPNLLLIGGQVAELLWSAYDPHHRRIGDRIAKTRVADSRPGQGEAAAIAGIVACALALAFTTWVLPVQILHVTAGG